MTNTSNFRATCPMCHNEIQMHLRLSEGIARRANTEQPLVRPPEVSENLPCSPDRQSLTELRMWAQETVQISMLVSDERKDYWEGVRATAVKVIQWLDSIDLGDGHSSPAKVPVKKKARSVKSKKAKK